MPWCAVVPADTLSSLSLSRCCSLAALFCQAQEGASSAWVPLDLYIPLGSLSVLLIGPIHPFPPFPPPLPHLWQGVISEQIEGALSYHCCLTWCSLRSTASVHGSHQTLLGGSQAVEEPAGMKYPTAPCCKPAHGRAAWQGALCHKFRIQVLVLHFLLPRPFLNLSSITAFWSECCRLPLPCISRGNAPP